MKSRSPVKSRSRFYKGGAKAPDTLILQFHEGECPELNGRKNSKQTSTPKKEEIMNTTTKQQESIDALAKKGTCIEFFSAYQDFDLDRMLSLFTPDATIAFEPMGADGAGKVSEVGKAIWSAVLDCFPDVDNTVKSQVFDEKTNSVTCSVVIFGTQARDFAGIPSKGLRFDSDHIFIFRFDDKGKIDKVNIDWDFPSFLKQLTGN